MDYNTCEMQHFVSLVFLGNATKNEHYHGRGLEFA